MNPMRTRHCVQVCHLTDDALFELPIHCFALQDGKERWMIVVSQETYLESKSTTEMLLFVSTILGTWDACGKMCAADILSALLRLFS